MARGLVVALLIAAVVSACARNDEAKPEVPAATPTTKQPQTKQPAPPTGDKWVAARHAMVADQISGRDITDARVLAAMRKVPRHEFVPVELRERAYGDHALPIGEEQTISQPYVVAAMTALAQIKDTSRVLEIGTGSGYQAAVLGELAGAVYTIEIVDVLARRSKALLERLGYKNIEVRSGDGYKGWPEKAPFDAILVTAAPPKIPEPLKQQLRVGARMVIPVGGDSQELVVVTRTKDGFDVKSVLPVRFVPMTGEAQK